MYPSWAVRATDRFMELCKEKSMWEMLDFIVVVWMKKNVKNSAELKKYVDSLRSTRKNKYASTEKKTRYGTDLGGQRHLGEIPKEIALVIEMFYSEDVESIGTRRFYYLFFKRYPVFRVADKL